MSKSDDTLAADLARAKAILTDGALWTLTDGYGLLARFVQYIETHFRPDHNGECLNCDEPLDGHDVFTELARLDAEVARLQRWEDAVLDACVVDWIYTRAHDTDPRQAVNDLLAWQQQIALDPTVSTDAKALHDRIAAQAAEIGRLRDRLEIDASGRDRIDGLDDVVAQQLSQLERQQVEIRRLRALVDAVGEKVCEVAARVKGLTDHE